MVDSPPTSRRIEGRDGLTVTPQDLTAGSSLTFEDAGERELKGVPDRWPLYRVVA